MSNVLEWFREKWEDEFFQDNCTFYIYKNDKELTNHELYQLGFLR